LTERLAGLRRGLTYVFLSALGLAVCFGFASCRGGESATPADGVSAVKSTLHLDTFVLNVADPEQRAYLRVGIDLGLNREPKHGEEPVPVAAVRDTILGVLSQTKVDDLLTPAGKTKLKDDLLRALQQKTPKLGVEEVYFTEFLIQR
jgi:flagellar basal body-associated protein FliL